MTTRSSQRTLDGPASIQAIPKGIPTHSEFSSAVRDALCSAVESEHSATTAVSGLLLRSGPHATVRFVVAIVVLSFNGMLGGWLIPHVLVEGFERLTPSFADYDSATAVPGILPIAWVVASSKHVIPRTVFRRPGLAMSSGPSKQLFSPEAPTATRVAAIKASPADLFGCSTVALANPVRISVATPSVRQHCPATEQRMPSQVFCRGWESNRIRVRHDRSSKTGLPRMARQLQLLGRSHFTSTAYVTPWISESLEKHFRFANGLDNLPILATSLYRRRSDGNGRKSLALTMNDMGLKKAVEVGCRYGASAQGWLENIPGLSLVCIDPYRAYHRISQERQDLIFKGACENSAKYGFKLIRKASLDAVNDFADGSLDWVHIDGDHSFDACVQDVIRWAPKVREGGLFLVLDYCAFGLSGVIPAIDAYTHCHWIDPWYVTRDHCLL